MIQDLREGDVWKVTYCIKGLSVHDRRKASPQNATACSQKHTADQAQHSTAQAL